MILRRSTLPRAAVAVLTALVALGAAVAADLASRRHAADRAARGVSLAVPYAEVVDLARRLHRPPEELFRALRRAGVTAVLAKEANHHEVEDAVVLSREDVATLGPAWAPVRRWADRLRTHGDLQTVLVTPSPERARELAQLLRAKGVPAVLWTDPDGSAAVATPLPPAGLDRVGLGFPVRALRALERDPGLDTYVQLKDREDESAPLAPLLEPLAELRRLQAVFFNDRRLPGWPERAPELAAALRRLDVPVGVIEGFAQEGLAPLVDALGGRAVRLHAVRVDEMERLPLERAVDRYRLAAAERGIRVLLLRVVPHRDPGASWERTLRLVTEVRQAVMAEGLAPGPPVPPRAVPPGPAARWCLVLGLAAAAALAGHHAALAGAGALAGLALLGLEGGLLLSGQAYLAQKLGASVTALVFPLLAALAVLRGAPRSSGAALAALAGATGLAAVGGLYSLAFQGHHHFLLRTDVPPGVKLAAVLPPVAVAGLALAAHAPAAARAALDALRRWRGRQVPVAWVALAPLALLLAVLYVSRTGNQPLVAPPELERLARQGLDAALGVRPRFKEFLFGHPLLLWALRRGVRGPWDAVLAGAGTVALASVVNTFSHAHTPVAASLLRTVHGLWLGAAVGLLWQAALARWGRRGGGRAAAGPAG